MNWKALTQAVTYMTAAGIALGIYIALGCLLWKWIGPYALIAVYVGFLGIGALFGLYNKFNEGGW